MKIHKLLCGLVLATCLMSLDALAASRGGFSGGSKSGGSKSWSSGSKSSGSRSSSWSSGSKSSGNSKSWSSTPKSPSTSHWSSGSTTKKSVTVSPKSESSWSSRSGSWSSTKSNIRPRLSDADKALASRAQQSGTSYSSRGDAAKAFQEKFSDKFTNKYSMEPVRRPDYIPQTTIIGGSTYNIIYDRTRCGYGYYSGQDWIMYDVLRDAIMLESLMNRNAYYYPRPAEVGDVVVGQDNTGLIILIVVLGVGAAIIIGVAVARS